MKIHGAGGTLFIKDKTIKLTPQVQPFDDLQSNEEEPQRSETRLGVINPKIASGVAHPPNDDPRDPWVLVGPPNNWMRQSYIDERRRDLQEQADQKKRDDDAKRSVELM